LPTLRGGTSAHRRRGPSIEKKRRAVFEIDPAADHKADTRRLRGFMRAHQTRDGMPVDNADG
jgi:hypothetical protein